MSVSPKRTQMFTGLGKLAVLTFEKDYSIVYVNSQEAKVLNILLFNFLNDTYSVSGYHLTEKKKPDSQLFECSKIR